MVSRKYLILVAMTGTLVSLDQLTKFLIVIELGLGESRQIVDAFFNLTRVHNAGAAFGLFSNMAPEFREPFFLFVPIVMLALIFTVFFRLKESQQLSIFAFSLIVGGALGNLMDRLRLGYVVDFLDFHWRHLLHFPAFNLADAAITLGVFLLLLSIFFEKEAPEETGAP